MNKMIMKTTVKQILSVQRMLWQLDRTIFLVLAFETIIDAVLPFIGIYLSAYVLDGLALGQNMTSLITTSTAVVGVTFVLTLLRAWMEKVYQTRRFACWKNFEKCLAVRTLTMDYELLESPAVNNIRNRVRSDNNWGSGFLSVMEGLPILYGALLSTIFSIFILLPLLAEKKLFADPLSLVVFLLFVGVIVFNCGFGSKMRKKLENYLTGMTDITKWMGYFLWRQQLYRQGMDIRIFKGQKLIGTYMDRERERILNYQKQIVRSESERGFGSGLASGLLQMTAYLFVALRAVAGALSAGSVVKYASTVYHFANAVSQLFYSFAENSIIAGRQQSTMDYMNIEDVLYKGTLPIEKRADNEYEIEFHNVSFRYPGTENYALKNLDFKFTVGKRLAVVGMNGSGKTTMIKLLCRLYDPTEGMITLNGIDIRKYNYQEYIKIFSVYFRILSCFPLHWGRMWPQVWNITE